MLLPSSYWGALLLAILSLLCWGSWASTYKATGPKWRFELYVFDFSIGVLLAALLTAFTLGQMGTDFLAFTDNVSVTGKRNLGYAAVAGAVFNLSNMLLLAGVSIAGMAVALPISLGLAMTVGAAWSYVVQPHGAAAPLYGGIAITIVAIVVAAVAWLGHAKIQAQNAGKKKAKGAGKAVAVSLISGLLLGAFFPILELSRQGEIGLGPYTIAVFVSAGVFFTTFVFNIYFMNLPIQGKAVDAGAYFQGTARQHGLGLLGGILWCAGLIMAYAAASVGRPNGLDPSLRLALLYSPILVAALWGIAVWKEFTGAQGKTPLLLVLMLALFSGGIALIALVPMLGR